MNPFKLINTFYPQNNEQKDILVMHSALVALKAVEIVQNHPELKLDMAFVYEAAMLHDIGMSLTDAPDIQCFGDRPYICHGYLGAELLVSKGFPRHALVCERHTGAGITLEEIVQRDLPLPHREMLPVSLEEQVICFADKFFSKSHHDMEKSVEEARKSVARHGDDGVARFDEWCRLFL